MVGKGNKIFGIATYNPGIIYCYDKAIAIDPNFADAWYNKASCTSSMGDKYERPKYALPKRNTCIILPIRKNSKQFLLIKSYQLGPRINIYTKNDCVRD